MNTYYLAPKHIFCVGSQVHVSALHLSFVIPLHEPALLVAVVADVPPKKNHALKRIIAAGINILNKILLTSLYWKLRADDIFTMLLYILLDIIFSWYTIFKQFIQPTKYFLSMAVLSAIRRNILPKSLFTSASSTGPMASIFIFKY